MNISVIVPLYNEEGNVETILKEIIEVLRPRAKSFEIIAINDGSKDRTSELLQNLRNGIPELRVLTHAANKGQGSALWTGFLSAQGDVIITTDGDCQNDFHDVPPMLDLLSNHDAVFGQRYKRNDPLQKKLASSFAFFCRRVILDDHVRDTACALRAMKRSCLQYILPWSGFFRFIPFLLKEAGVPFAVYAAHHRPRRFGKSKFLLLRLYFIPVIMDLIFMWWFKKKNLFKSGLLAKV